MPGRDYTRAFELFQLSLDDGYHWKPHADGLRGLTGLQTLPGDLWKRSQIDNQEHDMARGPRLQAKVFKLDTTRQTQTTSPSLEQPSPGLHVIRDKHTTQSSILEPSKRILQLPTPDTTPSSSGELFRPHMPGADLSSSQTASFMTARETSVTPTPHSIPRRPLRVDTSNSVRSDVTNARRRIDGLVSPNSPLPSINSVPTGSPKHVKAKSRGQKSLRADLEGVEDETQTEADDENDNVPILMRGLSMRNVNRGDDGLVPQASVRTLHHTPPPKYQLAELHQPTHKTTHTSAPSNDIEVIEAVVVDTTPPRRKRKLRHAAGDSDLRDTVSHSEHSNRTSYSDASSAAVRIPAQAELPSQSPTMPSLDHVGAGNAGGSPALRHTGKFEPLEPYPGPTSELHPQSVEPSLTISYSPSLLHQLESRRSHKDDTTAKRAISLPANGSPVQEKHAQHVYGASHNRSHSGGLGIVNLADSEKLWSPEDIGFSHRRGSHQSMVRRPSDVQSQHSSVGSTRFHGVYTQSSPVSFNSEAYTPHLDEAKAINLYPHNNTSLLLVQEAGLPGFNTRGRSPLGRGRYYARPVITVDVPKGNIEQNEEFDDDSESVIHHQTSNQAHLVPPILTLIPASPATGRNSASGLQLDPLDLEEPAEEYSPVRRSSLLKRARDYSDNVVQPFFSRALSSTGSVRRTLSRRRRSEITSKRISAPQPIEDPEELVKQEKLHPLWQPRDFWNGIDDDSEDDIVGVAAYERAIRKPPSSYNNTAAMTNEPSQRDAAPLSWRRGGSLRFLIGNTLGIDRQPTNRRLQMVRWPTGRTRKIRPRITHEYIRPVQDHRTALPPGLEYATAPNGVFVERHDMRRRGSDNSGLLGKLRKRVGERGEEGRAQVGRKRRRGGRRRLMCGVGR